MWKTEETKDCTDFREILYPNILRKFVQKIQAALKSDKNNWSFT